MKTPEEMKAVLKDLLESEDPLMRELLATHVLADYRWLYEECTALVAEIARWRRFAE